MEGIFILRPVIWLYIMLNRHFSVLADGGDTPHRGGRNASKVAEMSFQSLSLADKRTSVVICVYKGKKLYLMLLPYLCSQLKCYTIN